MYLLDTNICIYIINNSPLKVVQHIKTLNPHQIKLSAISLADWSMVFLKAATENKIVRRWSILPLLLIF